jgi:uncharacterized protein with HEPN domain
MRHDPDNVMEQDRNRLMHMLESARRAQRYCTGMTRETLEADEMRFLAVLKSIEVVGEAAAKVSEATRARLVGIDWLGMRRMRNRLIHGYDTIDPHRVWDAVELEIPGLIEALEAELRPGGTDEQKCT